MKCIFGEIAREHKASMALFLAFFRNHPARPELP
jgi:hypothetical protein